MKAQFIECDYIKRYSNIDNNVDDDRLVPIIFSVQDMYLQQALGSSFYKDLMTKINNETLNSDEVILVKDYIRPMLLNYIGYEAVAELNYKITNKAVSQESSEFSNASDLDTIKYLRSNYRNKADFYNKRLVKYLCDYSNLFEKYNNPDAKENLEKSSKVWTGGVYIPKRGTGNIRRYNDPSNDCDDC